MKAVPHYITLLIMAVENIYDVIYINKPTTKEEVGSKLNELKELKNKVPYIFGITKSELKANELIHNLYTDVIQQYGGEYESLLPTLDKFKSGIEELGIKIEFTFNNENVLDWRNRLCTSFGDFATHEIIRSNGELHLLVDDAESIEEYYNEYYDQYCLIFNDIEKALFLPRKMGR